MRRTALVAAVVAVATAVVSSASGGAGRAHPHTPSDRSFSAVIVDPLDSNTVYVAGGSGIFKSGDGGAHWQAASDGLRDRHVYDLVPDVHDSATLYAATPSGVFKSTDAARTWKATGLMSQVWTLALDASVPSGLYAAGDGRVLRTTDGGASWETALKDESERFFAVAVDPRYPSTIYAGAGSGVFKSIDGGLGWRIMSRGLLDDITAEEFKWRLDEGFVTALAIDPRHSQTLYLGSYNGVFKSTNRALRWRAVNSGLTTARQRFKIIGSLAIDPRNPQTVYVGADGPAGVAGVFKTSNGGRSWRSTHLPAKEYVLALALDPQNPRTVYAGTTAEGGGHLFKSTDAGRTWHTLRLLGS